MIIEILASVMKLLKGGFNVFKNLKIGKKLIISFLIITLLASISGIAGFVITFNIDNGYTALVKNGFSQSNIGQFNTYLNKGGALVRDVIFASSQSELKEAENELADIKAKTVQALIDVKEDYKTQEELTQIKIIDENILLYQQKCDEVMKLAPIDSKKAFDMFKEEARPLLNTCMNAADTLVSINETRGNDMSIILTRHSRIYMTAILAVIVLAFVVSILFGTYVKNTISKSIELCSDRLKLLSDGDLHSPVPYPDSMDEAGMMLIAMKRTIEKIQYMIKDINRGLGELSNGNLQIAATSEFVGDFIEIEKSIDNFVILLNKTLVEINQSSEQVASSSKYISNSAQILSQGASEQASSIEELASGLTEISERIEKNAENAKKANEVAKKSGGALVFSNKKMKEMNSAMNKITEKSGEIRKIIKTIEDIAFQTNILALNAAVEAARAGESGKGFSVVAEEVRNLASKSAEAAKNTTRLIEESLYAIENGTKIAEETNDSLMDVVGGAEEITDLIDEIAIASEEQSNAVIQITVGINQISEVVQTNLANAEESASASQELSSQAQILKSLVKRFNFRQDNIK